MKPHNRNRAYIIAVTAILCLPVALYICAIDLTNRTAVASEQKPDFNVLIGDWVRPDGGYIVRVRSVKPDGTVDVVYLNPKEIHIAEARVSLWKGLVKLFIKLQDKGYPGSTYTLYYYAEKDALAGFYYQAAMQKTFKVVFLRKSNR
jgi:hypothetical protein